MISIIIPTLNEEEYLADCLSSVLQDNSEVIVVDGNSIDNTLVIAESFGAKVIRLDVANRAQQMNAGAKAASGDVLLFCHADSRLPAGGIEAIRNVMLDPKVIGGGFALGFYPVQPFYSFLAKSSNLFCQITHMIFGDRGIFIRANDFWRLGGYSALDIMEDAALATSMGKIGKIALLSETIMTSARKYASETKRQALYRTIWAYCAYRIGVPAEEIKAGYYGLGRKDQGIKKKSIMSGEP